MTGGRADGRMGGRWLAVVLLAAICAVVAPASLLGQDADSREIAAYRLTDAALAKYIRASRAMAAVAKTLPADTADEEDDDDEEEDDDNERSIAEIAAFYDSTPAVRRAITGSGLTTREFVVFTFALFQAGMASWLVEQHGWNRLPPDVPRANVEFYQRHKAQLDSLTRELKPDDQ